MYLDLIAASPAAMLSFVSTSFLSSASPTLILGTTAHNAVISAFVSSPRLSIYEAQAFIRRTHLLPCRLRPRPRVCAPSRTVCCPRRWTSRTTGSARLCHGTVESGPNAQQRQPKRPARRLRIYRSSRLAPIDCTTDRRRQIPSHGTGCRPK